MSRTELCLADDSLPPLFAIVVRTQTIANVLDIESNHPLYSYNYEHNHSLSFDTGRGDGAGGELKGCYVSRKGSHYYVVEHVLSPCLTKSASIQFPGMYSRQWLPLKHPPFSKVSQNARVYGRSGAISSTQLVYLLPVSVWMTA